MKLVTAFLAALLGIAWALTSTVRVIIKTQHSCPLVASLQFSSGGHELVRICMFGPVAMFDTTNYRRARTFLSEIEHTPELIDLAYSPDGTMIATARGPGGAAIWNTRDPGKPAGAEAESFLGVDELFALDNPIRSVVGPGVGGSVDAVGFSPDGKILLTAHSDGRVKIWNTSSWRTEGTLAVTDGPLSQVIVESDSRHVFVGCQNSVHEWDLKTKTEIRSLPVLEGIGIHNLQLSPDGKTLVAILLGKTLVDGSAIVWNTKDWRTHKEIGCNSAAFSADGRLLAFGGRGRIKLVEPDSGKEIRDIPLPEISMAELLPNYAKRPDADKKVPSSATAVAFSPDGKKIAAGIAGGTVLLVNANP